MHGSQFLNLFLQIIELIIIKGVSSGADWSVSSWQWVGFQPIFYLIFELFEPDLFLLELNLHVELSLLHVVVLLAGLIQSLFHLTNNSLFLFNHSVQSPFLAFLLRESLSIALRICQLFFELFDSFFIFLEVQHFILQEDVFFSSSRDLLLVLSHCLQQFLLKIVVHEPQLIEFRCGDVFATLVSIFFLQLLQLFHSFSRLHHLPLVLLAGCSYLLDLLSQQVILTAQLLQLLDQFIIIIISRDINHPLPDGVLNDFNKGVLAALIQMHDGLNILFLMGRLHEDRDDQLEESKDVRAGLVLCDLDQVYVLCNQRFSSFFNVGLHALHYDLQIGQFLNPLVRSGLQVLQSQWEVLNCCQDVREDHATGELLDVFEGTVVVWWKGGGEADEGVFYVLII